jgi:hypothetical protein
MQTSHRQLIDYHYHLENTRKYVRRCSYQKGIRLERTSTDKDLNDITTLNLYFIVDIGVVVCSAQLVCLTLYSHICSLLTVTLNKD